MSYLGVLNSSKNADLVNYISNGKALNGTAGWNAYADAAAAAPVDGTGGSPQSGLWSVTTTSPLRGSSEFLLSKTGSASRQGQGVSFDFTIDNADLAKVLAVTFDYEVVSGTYADGDVTVYIIADPSGTPQVIQPAGYTVMAGTAGIKLRQIATFQTLSNVTNYRLCLHIATASTQNYVLGVDTVRVGPQMVQYGAPITDFVAYTPQIDGAGTPTNVSFYYMRIGNSLRIFGKFSAGTPSSASARLYLPSGLVLDSAVLPDARNPLGRWTRNTASATTVKGGVLLADGGTNYLSWSADDYTSTLNPRAPQTGTTIFAASGAQFTVDVLVPIQGWSSSVQMSNDTDTRVVIADAYLAANTTAAPNNSTVDILLNGVNTDTHGVINTSTGTITIPVSGYYNINARIGLFGANVLANRYVVFIRDSSNTLIAVGSEYTATAATVNGVVASATSIFLNAGTILKLSLFGAGNNSSSQLSISGSGAVTTRLSVSRVSGPSAIAASETVAAKYTSSTTTITLSGSSRFINPTKDFDTHQAYNATTGEYTVPVSGKYRITAGFRTASATSTATGRAITMRSLIDGAESDVMQRFVFQGSLTLDPALSGSVLVSVVAGQKLSVNVSHGTSISDFASDGTAAGNYVSFERVGN